jgi:hypothetical protein
MAAATGGVAAAAGMTSTRIPGSVLATAIMAGIAWVAMRIMRLIGMEIVERLLSVCRVRSVVAVTRIVAIVDMAIKPVRTVKPRAGPNEYPANEPIGPIKAIGCAVIGSKVVVAIGAHRRHPNVDGNLRRRSRKGAQHGRSEKRKCNKLPMTHLFLL